MEKTKEVLASLNEIKIRIGMITSYDKDTKKEVNEIKSDLIKVIGTGDWRGHLLEHCKKSELVANIEKVVNRTIEANMEKLIKLEEQEKEKEVAEAKKNTPSAKALAAIHDNTAAFVGEGEWIKDSCYHVYKVNNKIYAVIVYDKMSKWVMDESIKEIQESEINQYI